MQGGFGIGSAIVYIRGKDGFQEEVLPKLRDDYLSGNSETDNLMMVWLPNIDNIRSLKWAVGCKTILKYRLRFFTGRNQLPGRPRKASTVFSVVEGGMENPMVVW
jgi:hypothetical protein